MRKQLAQEEKEGDLTGNSAIRQNTASCGGKLMCYIYSTVKNRLETNP